MKIIGTHDEIMFLKIQCDKSTCLRCVLRVFCMKIDKWDNLFMEEPEEKERRVDKLTIEEFSTIFISKGNDNV